jgi:hypothetical protein
MRQTSRGTSRDEPIKKSLAAHTAMSQTVKHVSSKAAGLSEKVTPRISSTKKPVEGQKLGLVGRRPSTTP